ncbi:MAG: HlyD family type I secretion periplasmic adaptor subunit [Proteobacteria bacterium]|nr:HlyD family type I secretion periplasmic adaptor subunit [Pseudomonadota bacterium]
MSWMRKKQAGSEEAAVDFLPDADEVEQRPLPRSARITLHALLAALLCFVVWAMVSDVDLVVVARGRLVTPLPNIVVQPLETSIIQQINVRQGQIVRKGEPLATLDPTFTAADEAELRTRLHSLNNQLEQLEGSLAGRKVGKPEGADADSRLQVDLSGERQASYGAQVRKLRETIEQTRAAMETNRRDQQVLASRVKVLKDMAAMQEQLVAEKYAVRSRLLDAQDRLLEAERSLQLATNKDAELRRELAAQEAEKASFETGWRQKLMEEVLAVSRERDAVAEQLQKAGKRHRMVVLSSPSDAVVLEIAKLSQGSVAKEAEPLFTLVPLGAALEAEVEVDSMDVGYLKVGDTAHLKFDAYPFQRHGTVPAQLRTISEDAFRKEAAGSATAFYTSRLRLDGGQLKRMPEHARLLPGMTLSAEIVVGKRSVMSYLVWPLVKALDESIREP